MPGNADPSTTEHAASAGSGPAQPGVLTPSAPVGPTRGRAEAGKLSVASAALLLGILGALVVAVVVLLILRRARWTHFHSARFRSARRKRTGQGKAAPPQPSAWTESAARLAAPRAGWRERAGLPPGAEDDTVDLDPDELGPDAFDDDEPNENGSGGDKGRGGRR